MAEVKSSYPKRLDANTGELFYLHRAIAEWKLGRSLRPGEVAHHANGDTQDNHPDNIWVFSSQRAHMLYHHYSWRQERGIHHLYSLDEVLRLYGEWVVR